MTADASAPLELLDLITAGWKSQAVYVAARLGVAEHLAGGARSADELAAITGVNADALYRLLRGLTTLGVCAEGEPGRFELAPLGHSLRADVDGSLRSLALHWGGSLWPIWGTLLHTVRTGQSVRPLGGGARGFDALGPGTEAARVFNQAMADITRLVAASVAERYDFSGIERLVDVGGGYGELLAAILRRYPAMRGVLFDRSHAVTGARAYLEAHGVAERCAVVTGDVFESVPSGADAYVLKSVLHDWNDERGVTILNNCRTALADRGRLLIVERVVPERLHPTAEHRAVAASDLNMLVAIGGRERTEAELRALLGRAGFSLTETMAVGAYFTLLAAACGREPAPSVAR